MEHVKEGLPKYWMRHATSVKLMDFIQILKDSLAEEVDDSITYLALVVIKSEIITAVQI